MCMCFGGSGQSYRISSGCCRIGHRELDVVDVVLVLLHNVLNLCKLLLKLLCKQLLLICQMLNLLLLRLQLRIQGIVSLSMRVHIDVESGLCAGHLGADRVELVLDILAQDSNRRFDCGCQEVLVDGHGVDDPVVDGGDVVAQMFTF